MAPRKNGSGRLGERAYGFPNDMYSGTGFRRVHHLHLLPVVGELFTAIETHYVRAGNLCGRGTARTAGRDGETAFSVPATEE